MRASHLRSAVGVLLALSLVVACSDKEAPPLKGSSPIPRGNPPGLPDASARDSGSKDSGAMDSGASDQGSTLDGSSSDGQATGTPCTVDCDCIQGQACVNKLCTTESFPYYCCNKSGCVVGQFCTDYLGQTGTCGTTGFCTGQCDCPQGLSCIASQCIVTPNPTYCCSKAGCPSGKNCIKSDGSLGTCS